MALISEWNVFRPGVIIGVAGAVVLLIMVGVWRKMENKEPVKISEKTIGVTLIGIVGALLLGVGMCLTMVWSNIVLGIVLGITMRYMNSVKKEINSYIDSKRLFRIRSGNDEAFPTYIKIHTMGKRRKYDFVVFSKEREGIIRG